MQQIKQSVSAHTRTINSLMYILCYVFELTDVDGFNRGVLHYRIISHNKMLMASQLRLTDTNPFAHVM